MGFGELSFKEPPCTHAATLSRAAAVCLQQPLCKHASGHGLQAEATRGAELVLPRPQESCGGTPLNLVIAPRLRTAPGERGPEPNAAPVPAFLSTLSRRESGSCMFPVEVIGDGWSVVPEKFARPGRCGMYRGAGLPASVCKQRRVARWSPESRSVGAELGGPYGRHSGYGM